MPVQAGGATGAASAASRAASSRISDSEKPFMLSAVMNGPGPSSRRTRGPRAERSTSRATTPISIGGTDAEVVEDQRVVGAAGGRVAASRSAMVATIAEIVGEVDLLDAGLAVDAEAELGLVVAHARLERPGRGWRRR